jgi:predicted dinucleotide-binding enzyme
MNIGILGSGAVGLTLGAGFINLGYHITIGTRNPAKESLQQWARRQGPGAAIGTFRAAAEKGDRIIICTAWPGTKGAIEQAGIWNFKGKTVVDVTNPVDGKGPDEEGRQSFVAGLSSAGEQIQAWLPPDAYVVKALSCVGHEHMFNSRLGHDTPTMFICGNNAEAKQEVTDILNQMHWKDVVDMGMIEMSRYIEPLSILWYAYGYRTGTWDHAFKLVKKTSG